MHPAGIEFGLSRRLLQFRCEEVLWPHLKKPPIRGNFLVDLTIRVAGGYAVKKGMANTLVPSGVV